MSFHMYFICATALHTSISSQGNKTEEKQQKEEKNKQPSSGELKKRKLYNSVKKKITFSHKETSNIRITPKSSQKISTRIWKEEKVTKTNRENLSPKDVFTSPRLAPAINRPRQIIHQNPNFPRYPISSAIIEAQSARSTDKVPKE